MEHQAANNRRASRHRVLKGAKISFHQLGTSTDCTIRNMSDTGACLAVESQVGIPNDFDLVLDSSKTVKHCHVQWRSNNKIGVSFRN
jgi:PilZ domain